MVGHSRAAEGSHAASRLLILFVLGAARRGTSRENEITRRRFLGTAATLGAGAVAAPAVAEPGVHPPGWSGTQRVEQIATTCEMCFWRCGILAEVADGKVVRITGNPDHPLTQGRLCARGNAGTELLYDPDRLKYPLLRIGKRGEGRSNP